MAKVASEREAQMFIRIITAARRWLANRSRFIVPLDKQPPTESDGSFHEAGLCDTCNCGGCEDDGCIDCHQCPCRCAPSSPGD